MGHVDKMLFTFSKQKDFVMFTVEPKFLIQHRVNVKGEQGGLRR